MNWIEKRCVERGVRMTDQRRLIAKVISEATDHPDADEIYNRVSSIDSKTALATVYRTLKLFSELNIIEAHDFGEGRSRYETADHDHHDHLIDVSTGDIIEFFDEDIEILQRKIATRLGYELVDHRLELYGRKIK